MTSGPVSRPTIEGVHPVSTKNWIALFLNSTLHFVVSFFPFILVMCPSTDNVRWNEPCSIVNQDALPDDWGSFQEKMVFRGGTQLVPWPENPNVYVSLLHSRIECRSPSGTWSHVYRPHLVLIESAPSWGVRFLSGPLQAYTSEPLRASALSSSKLENEYGRWIQYPVSITRILPESGDIEVAMNIGDFYGSCILGTISNPFGNNIEQAFAQNVFFQEVALTKALTSSCDAMQKESGFQGTTQMV
jgi:hypothetical protein